MGEGSLCEYGSLGVCMLVRLGENCLALLLNGLGDLSRRYSIGCLVWEEYWAGEGLLRRSVRGGDGDRLRGDRPRAGDRGCAVGKGEEFLVGRNIAAAGDGERCLASGDLLFSGVRFLFLRADFGSAIRTDGFSFRTSSSDAVLERRASDVQAADLTIEFSGIGGGLYRFASSRLNSIC